MPNTRRPPRCHAVLFVFLFSLVSVAAVAQAQGPTTVRRDVHHDVSPPLREMIRNARPGTHEEREAEPRRSIPLPPGFTLLLDDPVRQQNSLAFSPQLALNFEGLGDGQYNFWVEYVPPDTNGAVGLTQYVQWVNTYFAVFDKRSGALVAGPAPGNSIWTGFGGGCDNNNDGDPIVLFDKLANRWVMGQFSVSTSPYLQCIAVSLSPDATGAWYRYAFQYTYFDDYPKMGVWPDAYYETFNMFDDDDFVGSDACAYDRVAMLNGEPATQICFQQGPTVGGLLPADVDGTTAPPSGSPNYMMTYGANSLELYKFHVDFNTPSNSTFTGPTAIPVAAFTPLCNGGRDCVPQLGADQQLDSLADRLMYRLAYRNFGQRESLVVNHSVAVNGSSGIRWYEIQAPGGTPVVAQQGTYAPDTSYRWMGSAAMDHIGDLAVGYSVSSAGKYPSIAFAGRMPSDPAGTLEAETSIFSGSGSQTNANRWGDYSAMTVDPVDDCTFWYTQQYQPANGAFNWHTRITNFKFPGCSSGGYIGFFPATLSFGDQARGTQSAAQPITLSDLESAPLTISSIIATGDFVENNNCGTRLAANAQCTINVSFRPTATGLRTGTLTVTDNGPGSPRVANLAGLGTLAVTCTPNTLSNGSFESGTMQCWTAGGALVPHVSTARAQAGSFSALLGATGMPEPDGDSWIYQTITVPTWMQDPILTFWYWPWSSDTIDHNWQEAQLRDSQGNMLAQIFKAASNTQTWTPVSFNLSAYVGWTLQLYFNVHEDGYGDPTYLYLDDVSIADGLSGLRFIPVTPCRVADTRGANGTFGGPSMPSGTSRAFPIPQANCGIPQTAAAYSLNVSAVPHGSLNFLTIWPAGSSLPTVATLNSYDGRIKANAAIVAAGSNQAVSVFVTDTADVILDIDGYFVSESNNSALAFFPLSPCRVVDTRGANGALGGPQVQNGQSRNFPVLQAHACNIPSTAQAYSLNFAALPKNGRPLGYLTVWPAGKARPVVSTLNAPTGTITANAAIVPAGTGGDIMVYPYGNATDLVVDINGYFAPASSAPNPMSLYNVQPCRVLDTRNPSQGHLFESELTVSIMGGPCPLPSSANAYVLNATVVPSGPLEFLTLWADGQPQPVVATLNAIDGAVTSNMAIVPTTDGKIDSFAFSWTNLILDVFSYFAP